MNHQEPADPRFDFAKNAWVGDSPFPDLPASTTPAPGRWHRSAPPVRKRHDLSLAGLALGSTAIVVGMASHLGGIALAGLGTVIGAAANALSIDSWPPAKVDVERLLEDPEDLNVCAVEIRIVRSGNLVGKDYGAAWIDAGTLHFSGSRTSFAIGGENVLPKDQWRIFDTSDGYTTLPDTGVPLAIDGRAIYVAFRCLPYGDRSTSYSQELRFLRKLRFFKNDPKPSTGPRQWPPFES